MIGIAVSGIQKVQANLARAAAEMRAATESVMKRATILVGANVRIELSDPGIMDAFWGKQSPANDRLTVRSGKTRASITAGTRVYRIGETVFGVVGSAEKHLALIEEGGRIPGGSAKGYARIPTANAQTAAGVDRYAGMSIRDIPNVFLVRTSKGKLWAVRAVAAKRTKRSEYGPMAADRMEFLYLLVKNLKFRARHIFKRTAEDSQKSVVALTKNEVSAVVKKANS